MNSAGGKENVSGKTKYRVWLDKDRQIIRQEIDGELNEEDARVISETTIALGNASKEPDKVRILIKHANFIKTPSKVRKIFTHDMKKGNLYRIAVMGRSPGIKAMLFFLTMATGLNKLKMFKDEGEAIRWLNE
jgi:hypothetical protein